MLWRCGAAACDAAALWRCDVVALEFAAMVDGNTICNVGEGR
jgi:hypothetical protein